MVEKAWLICDEKFLFWRYLKFMEYCGSLIWSQFSTLKGWQSYVESKVFTVFKVIGGCKLQ